MKRLKKYARTSSLMDVRIKYGSDVFKFNLFEELKILEVRVNDELLEQPQVYGFLSMLHKKLIKKYKDLLQETEKILAKKRVHFYTSKFTEYYKANHSRPSEKIATAMAEASKEYQEALTNANSSEHDMNIVGTCVKAFEQRAFLIQTLSANIRKHGS